MIKNSILTILLASLAIHCSVKSQGSESSKVKYSDRENPHAKMQLPLEISWEHEKAGNPNIPFSIQITATAMSNLANAKIKITLSPNLKLINGDTSKTIGNLTAGNSTTLNLTVAPEKTGYYDINVLLNASLNGEEIGTARTIRFETADYVTEKPQPNPSGLHITEGRTDNGK